MFVIIIIITLPIMIESIIVLWVFMIYIVSLIFKETNLCGHFIQKFIQPDGHIAHNIYIVSIIIYRVYVILNFYRFMHDYGILIYLSNILIFTMDCMWFLGRRFGRWNILLYIFPSNTIEMILHLALMSHHNSFISQLCIKSIIAFYIPFIAIIKLINFTPSQTNQSVQINNINNHDPHINWSCHIHRNRPTENGFCYICREEYQPDAEYYLLECNHHAHIECMDDWWNSIGDNRCIFNYC